MPKLETIQFANDHSAALIRVKRDTSAAEIIRTLALPPPRATLCLNGGTAELEADLKAQLERLIAGGVAQTASAEKLTLLTGGTDAGIFALLGHGLAKWGRPSPCIGVVPEGRAAWPGHEGGDTALEPHHSHFVLVEGGEWGDETETMSALAAELSREHPYVAVFAGGGGITVREMLANTRGGRQMILLAGSGRKTDAVLAVKNGEKAPDATIAEIAERGRIFPFDLKESAEKLGKEIRVRLAIAQ